MTTLNPKPHVLCLDWAVNLWLAGFKDVQGLEKEYIWGLDKESIRIYVRI